jgi:hypothetical protein
MIIEQTDGVCAGPPDYLYLRTYYECFKVGYQPYNCCAWAGGTFLPVVPLCKIFGCGRKWLFVLLPSLEYNRYMMGRRNRYFKEMEDRQMTPC